jgi:hypothetical protein
MNFNSKQTAREQIMTNRWAKDKVERILEDAKRQAEARIQIFKYIASRSPK